MIYFCQIKAVYFPKWERAEQMKKHRENGDKIYEQAVKRARGSQQKMILQGPVSEGKVGDDRPKRTVLGFGLGDILEAGGFSWVVEGHRQKDDLDVAMKFIKYRYETSLNRKS